KDGSFGLPVQISPVGVESYYPQVAVDKRGDAVAVWESYYPNTYSIYAAIRPKDGSFGAATPISDLYQNTHSPQVAFDSRGNAVAVWMLYDGANYRIETAFRPR